MIVISQLLHAQVSWLRDDFRRSDIGPAWHVASGSWKLQNGALTISTRDYDQLLASRCYVYGTTPYSIEVILKGARAGVFFNLDDTTSKVLSQMVRFDENSILTGHFDGGGLFTATNTFDVPPSGSEWRTMRIDVDPLKYRFHLSVDGTLLGTDTCLVFPSGYVGLQASEGTSVFSSITVTSSLPSQLPEDPAIGSPPDLRHVSFVADGGERINCYMPEIRKLVSVDRNGIVRHVSSLPVAPLPSSTLSFGGKVFQIDGNKLLVTSADNSRTDSISTFLVAPSSLAFHEGNILVADPGARSVFEFAVDGHHIRTINASSLGGLKAPRGIAVMRNGDMAIADYDRIVLWPGKLDTDAPDVSLQNSDSVIIRWPNNSDLAGWVEYGSDKGPWKRVLARRNQQSGNSECTLKRLRPLTRYQFRYFPALKTIPVTKSISKTYRFATSPSSAESMAVTRLPLLCMVYRTVSYRDRYPNPVFANIPSGRRLSDDELEYLKKAVDFNREFYFRNSGCRLVLDFDFFVVEDTLWLREVGDADPYWLGPNKRVTSDFEAAAKALHRKPEDYAGLVCPYAWLNYPPRRAGALRDPTKGDTITIRQAVGGGTYGVPAPWKYGVTAGYTSNPFQDRFSRQDWLVTHEFHHQLDALMDASGFQEYYHADQPWKMSGRFGEDFDFNAQILRRADLSWWLSMGYGRLVETRDEDQDGVPDNDASLPFDEKRLGSNPRAADTDADSVSDLSEVMMGSSRSSNLLTKDSDGDGTPDNLDPEPLYPIEPVIHKFATANPASVRLFGPITDSTLTASIAAGWTDSALCFRCTSDRPVNLLVQIDAESDGWFHGFDNFQIRILNSGASAKVADYYLRDCSSWTDPPRDRRDILRASDLGLSSHVSIEQATSKPRYEISFRVPRNERFGLRLNTGDRLALRFGVQTTTDYWVWNEMLERNSMMQVTLR